MTAELSAIEDDDFDADAAQQQIVALQVQLEAALLKIAGLERALAKSRQIGAAVGVLMATQRLQPADAFARLVEVSQRQNRKVRDVAEDVLFTGCLP